MTAPMFPKPVARPKAPRRPLQRATRLRARTWMRRRPPRRLDRPQNDEARKDWCRNQNCYRCDRVPTDEYPSQACHEGPKPGMGLKCDDALTFPMCGPCHRQWTDGQSTNGFARHWSKAKRREWADEMIALATSRYLSHGTRRAA